MNKKVLRMIFVVFCVITCTMLTISAKETFNKYNPNSVPATNYTTTNTVNTYINSVNAQNLELSKTDLTDITTTITFSESMSVDELTAYINAYNIDAVRLQARGYDKDGKRITFFSKTDLGIETTYQMLTDMAKDGNIEFAGVIGMYALIDSEYIQSAQNDGKTLLLDMSTDKQYNEGESASTFQTNATSATETTKQSFVNTIAWDAEDLGLVYYEVLE